MKNGMKACVGVVAMVGLVCGCAMPGFQKAQQGAASMSATKIEVEQAFHQVTAAIKSLDTLMDAQVGDLRPLYNTFVDEVKTLESAAMSARSRAQTMQVKNREYLAKWAQEIQTIQDPATKAQSLERFNMSKASYAKVEQMLFKTGDAYAPMLRSLTDLQTALNQDLTPGGVKAVRPSYTKARQQAIDLQAVIKETVAAIDAAAKQLTPAASGAKAVY
jgi:hypothetical protein